MSFCLRKNLLLVLVLALLFLAGCGSGATHLEKGKAYLEKGLFRPAQVEYYAVINPDNGSDPKSCEGHYGYLLSLESEFVEFGGWMDMIGMGIIPLGDFFPDPSKFPTPSSLFSFSPPAVFPNAYHVPAGATDSVIDTFIIPTINQFLLPLENSAKFVIQNNCSFETAGIPIYINGDTYPSMTVRVGKKFGPAEANLFGAILSLQLAVMDYLTSLDFNAEAGSYVYLANQEWVADPVGFVRQLGPAMTSAPNFLNFHATRGGMYYNQVVPNLANFLERMAAAMRLTFLESGSTTDAEAREHFLGYYDANQNGALDSGDSLYLGILDIDPPVSSKMLNTFIDISQHPINVLGKSFVWTVITGDLPEKAEALFLKIRDNLTGTSSELFNLAEINGLLPPGFQVFPDTFALDLHTIFPPDLDDAPSLRSIFPAWGTYDPPGGDPRSIILLEGEYGSAATMTDYRQEVAANDPAVFAYDRGPGPHFSSQVYGSAAGYFSLATESKSRLLASTGSDNVVTIPDDCIQLQETMTSVFGLHIPLIYIYWQDPSFKHGLYVNLQSLRTVGGACDALDAASSSATWARDDQLLANQYSMNKAFNALVKTFMSLLGSLPL